MRTLFLITLLAGAACTISAGDLVEFNDGRTLKVVSWEPLGNVAMLSLEGGGEITVPLSRIANVRNLPAPSVAVERATSPGAATDWQRRAGEYAGAIEQAAVRHGLDPVLLAAMAEVETAFDPFAVSHKGACGMLQLMPKTAERFGVEDVFDVNENLDGGARYLRWLLDRFDGETELALAAYNAGEHAVDRYGGIPPYRETKNYVTRILARIP